MRSKAPLFVAALVLGAVAYGFVRSGTSRAFWPEIVLVNSSSQDLAGAVVVYSYTTRHSYDTVHAEFRDIKPGDSVRFRVQEADVLTWSAEVRFADGAVIEGDISGFNITPYELVRISVLDSGIEAEYVWD